jgi:C-terminal processing protease CtpA/Prc
VRLRSLALVLAAASLTACEPAPDRLLDADEKTADMLWLYAQFDQNYAPRELKAATFDFDYEELKDAYLEEALATTTNEAFYDVMHRFVAEFHDAHTSASLTASALPGRTEIAYLGFNGVRVGDELEVTELLPTTSSQSSFPIRVGDRITKLDGTPLRAIVLDEMVRHRSLGYDEANLTMHMNGIFSRSSLVMPLPTALDATLTVDRGGTIREIRLPWIRKDLNTFVAEQSAAAAQADTTIAGLAADEYLAAARELLDSDDLLGVLDVPVAGLSGRRAWTSFKFIDNMPTLTSPSIVERVRRHLRGQADASVEDLEGYLTSMRNLPDNAFFLPEAATFPTYIAPFPSADGDAPRFFAYMLLDNFTPADEAGALDEIQATLGRLRGLKIKHLIIDTIDNGGGSLTFGLAAARLFSRTPLLLPKIQFKTSETWIDKFETDAFTAPSDAEKELARRIMVQLKADRDAGKTISDPMPVDVLMPFQFVEGNEDLPDLQVALLVNEMCVSMCDIFAGVMQDNRAATIIGTRTMGGGGNVVQHFQAPNSHLIVSQTESLILRHDGTPIENVGVTPEIKMDVNLAAAGRYDEVRDRAIELLDPCTGEACAKTDDLGDGGDDGGGCATGGGASALGGLLLGLALVVARRWR